MCTYFKLSLNTEIKRTAVYTVFRENPFRIKYILQNTVTDKFKIPESDSPDTERSWTGNV